MKLIKLDTYEEMSELAAAIISSQLISKSNSILGLATGSSPIRIYEILVENYKRGILDFKKVKTVNLDEYFGIEATSQHSYRYFMNEHLFDKVNIYKDNTYVPNGMAQDMEKESQRYEELIDDLGGIDLQLLGIGHNGHIGFNEPSDMFHNKVHGVSLASSTIEANSRLFDRKEEVPVSAITMGIGTIMRAKKIVLIAQKSKEKILQEVIYGPVKPQVPASILQLHPDVTIIMCKE